MNASARKELTTVGLIAVAIAIALSLTQLAIPYLVNVFGPIPDRLLFWIPIWLVAFPTAIGFGMLAGFTLMSANDDLDDIPRKGYLNVVSRIAAKTALAGGLGTVAICAFLLLPDI